MKLINKNKLRFENGYIMKKNKIVPIPRVVALQLMQLETAAQMHDYLISQPAYHEAPSILGFKKKSAFENSYVIEKPDTPVTDRRVEEAMAFMNEMDSVEKTEKAQEAVDSFRPLLDWVADDKVLVDDDNGWVGRLDLYTLGNPLELDVVTLMEVICHLSKAIVLEDC